MSRKLGNGIQRFLGVPMSPERNSADLGWGSGGEVFNFRL